MDVIELIMSEAAKIDSGITPLPSFISDNFLYMVTIMNIARTAVMALMQLDRKKYQHQENAQPGGVSSDAILYNG